MIDELLKLSKIFKAGFTIELIGGEICQYAYNDKPYIVSYLTLIEIRKDKTVYNNIQHIPNNCIIGGWLDIETDIYYIELNLAFDTKEHAITVAKAFNQKAIYNTVTGKTTEV